MDVRAAPVHTVVATVTVKSWCVARVAGLPKCVNKHIRAVVCTAGGADVYGVKNQMLALPMKPSMPSSLIDIFVLERGARTRVGKRGGGS